MTKILHEKNFLGKTSESSFWDEEHARVLEVDKSTRIHSLLELERAFRNYAYISRNEL